MLLFASIITQTYLVHATSLEKEILIDTKELKLSYDVIELDNKLEWQIYAEKNTENSTKLKFEVNATNIEKFSSDTILEQKDNNNQNIYVEEEYSNKNNSELVFTTGKEENSIDLSIQMDEEVVFYDGTTQINENMLDVSLAGPYELKFKNQIDSIIPEESSDKSENLIVEEADTSIEELEENLVIGPQMRSSLMGNVESASPLAATGTYTDLFSYTTLSDSSVDGVKGIYPKISTNSYLNPTGTSDFIRNFDYARSYTATPKTINILNGTQNFTNGYHNYQMDIAIAGSNVMTKKTVKPNSADPTKFDIQLDIIGGTTEVKKPVDVVFVIDKSSSMNDPIYNGAKKIRWEVLQEAMTKFSNELLSKNQFDIQMGLVAFGSVGRDTLVAETDSFSSGSYFTKNASELMKHKVIGSKRSNDSSGTPTFMGVDLGVEMLNKFSGQRANAEKFLIILTDGAATFYPPDNTSNISSSFRNNRYEITNKTTRYNYQTKSWEYEYGNGSESQEGINNVATRNSDFIKNRYAKSLTNAKKYSIGFGSLTDNMRKVLVAAGPDKPVDPKSPYLATDSYDLEKVLAQITNNITSVNNNFRAGSVIDPMSEYVTYDKNSVKTSALTLKGNTKLDVTEINSTSSDYAKNVVVSKDDNQITLENMNLGGSETERYGYRLNYTVQLKSDYQNGNFYPANGPTYAYEPNYNRTLGFAVPSVKVQPSKAEITVEKKWNDQDNKFKKRQDVIFQLQKSVKGSSSWENISDKKLTIAANATGEALKGSFGEVVFKVGKTEYEYRVIENNVDGYDMPKYSLGGVTLDSLKHVVVTNTLQTMNIQMKKVAGDGTTALAGAGFTVFKKDDMSIMIPEKTSGADGLLNFSDLPIGTYVLRETKVPNGFKPMSDITFEIKHASDMTKLSVTGLPEKNILKNNLNEFSLMVTKKDQYEQAVTGVTFKLKEIKTGKETILKSENNKFKFSSLVSGDYVLEEIVTPNSYAILEQPIKIAISALGIVTVDGIKKENVLTQDGNIIKLTVINKAKGVLPQTGGSGYEQYKLASLGLFIPMLGLSGYYLYKNGKGAKTYAKKKKRT